MFSFLWIRKEVAPLFDKFEEYQHEVRSDETGTVPVYSIWEVGGTGTVPMPLYSLVKFASLQPVIFFSEI